MWHVLSPGGAGGTNQDHTHSRTVLSHDSTPARIFGLITSVSGNALGISAEEPQCVGAHAVMGYMAH